MAVFVESPRHHEFLHLTAGESDAVVSHILAEIRFLFLRQTCNFLPEAGRERQIKKFPHPPDLFETEYRFRKTGSNLVKIRRKTGNRAEHQHKAGDSHGSVCEAVNQKAIADAVAQKLQREGQQIVREVGTADVKQDFLVSFVDLSVDTINPSAHIDVTKEVLL